MGIADSPRCLSCLSCRVCHIRASRRKPAACMHIHIYHGNKTEARVLLPCAVLSFVTCQEPVAGGSVNPLFQPLVFLHVQL